MQVACLLITRLDMFVFSQCKKKMVYGNSRWNGTCDMSDICSLTSYNFFFICYIILYIHYNTSTIILVSSITIVIKNV